MIFDFLGTGETLPVGKTRSVLEYSDQVVGMLELIRDKKQFSRVGVFASTSGSLVAQNAVLNFDFSVFWEPVMEPGAYFRDLIRSNLLQQQSAMGRVVNDRDSITRELNEGNCFSVEGHQVSAAFADSVSELPPFYQSVGCCPSPSLIVSLSRGNFEQSQRELYPDVSAQVDNLFEPVKAPFWKTSCVRLLELPLPCMEVTARWINEKI